MEIGRTVTLRKMLGSFPVANLNHGILRDYRDWRGHTRACELDIVTLASACRWAYRNPDQTGLLRNPMPMDRPRFAPTKQHCRERQPSNALELHLIAKEMMKVQRTAIFGWMTLFLAFTGLRIGRAREFKWDATNHEAGHFDGECLWVGVSNTHKGVFPFIRLHEALTQWYQAFKEWRMHNNIASPWYFPSPQNPAHPVGSQSLEHAMRRICEKLSFKKCSPHGLRSYYVNVLRSQGVMDSEIALRIGHRSGGRLIVDVYVEVLPHSIGFLPEPTAIAWDSVTASVTISAQK
jgi:integrase